MRNNYIKPDNGPNIRNASGKDVPIVETIDLMVQIVMSTEFVTVLVVDRLAISIILECDFSNRHVEAIKLRLAIFEMDDGLTMPIVRKQSMANKKVTIPEEQQFFSSKNVLRPTLRQPNVEC